VLPEFSNIFGSGDYRAVHLGRSSSTACIHIQGYTLSVIGRFPSISVLYNTHQFQPQSRLAFTNCFPSRPSIGAPALTYSSIISPKLFKPSRIIPQDGCSFICKPVSDPCVLFYLLTSVLCRLSCPACYHLSGLKDFCSELLCDIVVTS
jgi:hypothetical protein